MNAARIRPLAERPDSQLRVDRISITGFGGYRQPLIECMRLMSVALGANVEKYSLGWRCSSVSNIVQTPASDQIDEGFRQYLAFDTENDVGESRMRIGSADTGAR